MLLRKMLSVSDEEQREAEREIVEEIRERQRHIADLAQLLANLYNYAERVMSLRQYNMVADALSRTDALRDDLGKACEEERSIREKFLEVRGKVRYYE